MTENRVSHEDGFLNVDGLNLYFERFGKGNKYKMLALHGGPGSTHDYLLPLADLAERDFDIVFFDQFGCGKSDYPKSEDDYSLEFAVKQVDGFRGKMFGSQKIHLFGNSWGGMLSLAYSIKHQDKLKSMISCSGLSSVPQTVSEMKRLISELPEKYRHNILVNEEKGDYENPEYIEGVQYFYRQHLLRLDDWPEELLRSDKMTTERGTYRKMNGPSEFTIIGIIKDIDFTDELDLIKIPTLITCGKYDEVTPAIAETIHREIEGSQMVVFQNSSHMQFWEERSAFMNVIEKFVKEHD